MKPVRLYNRSQLARYFHQDIILHLYSLGDLDDFYWPKVTCYGIQTDNSVDKVVLLYQGEDLPVFLAFAQEGVLDDVYIDQLLQFLPDRLYAHLSPGVEEAFSVSYRITDYGKHFKMALQDPTPIETLNTENTVLLTENDRTDIQFL